MSRTMTTFYKPVLDAPRNDDGSSLGVLEMLTDTQKDTFATLLLPDPSIWYEERLMLPDLVLLHFSLVALTNMTHVFDKD